MSGRYHGYDKGSSRSARDDSRRYERSESRREEKRRSSRSRSPRRRSPKNSSDRSHSSQDRDRNKYERKERKRSPTWEIEEDVPAPPPPPRITKISIGFSKPKAPIKMSLGGPPKPSVIQKPAVASVFNTDDDDEPEEMPAEAKMRMRNIGRETPTSAGPNSFGKTKQGFCDAKKVFEKNMKQALDTVEKPTATKFPQTIYKISGP